MAVTVPHKSLRDFKKRNRVLLKDVLICKGYHFLKDSMSLHRHYKITFRMNNLGLRDLLSIFKGKIYACTEQEYFQ